jgi:hypothetical protein
MGSIIVTFYNLPGCSFSKGSNPDHQFIVKLPSEYVINTATANVIVPNDASVETDIKKFGDNQILVEIYAADLVDKVKIALDIKTYIPTNAAEAITASIIAQPGSVFNDGIVQIARTGFGLVTVEVREPISLNANSSDRLEIYFHESQANALREGPGSMTIQLPPGFAWAEPTAVELICLSSGSGSSAFYIEEISNQTLRFNRKDSSEQAYSWKLTTNIKVDKSAAAYEDITVKIDETSSIHPKSIMIGKYLAEDADDIDEEPIVSPTPVDTLDCQFKVGSKEYRVNGEEKIMDVAPYIKGDRTYVPMRYLGEILGAEVVWDDAARTVTLTRGDITVVFIIGSTSYTVNGEAKTADVAPEITNDRTMLPARFVAEAFGVVVGWDAATRTVLIQK